jgi:hypothetical protein
MDTIITIMMILIMMMKVMIMAIHQRNQFSIHYKQKEHFLLVMQESPMVASNLLQNIKLNLM